MEMNWEVPIIDLERSDDDLELTLLKNRQNELYFGAGTMRSSNEVHVASEEIEEINNQ